jgi:hypothetical protein
MYENYNNQPEHKYQAVFKQYRNRHLPKGEGMSDGEFMNAKVDVTLEQMEIKCGFV